MKNQCALPDNISCPQEYNPQISIEPEDKCASCIWKEDPLVAALKDIVTK